MTEPIARTIDEFCIAYGISRSLAYELKDEGELVFVKVRGRTLVDEESAKSWYSRQPRSHARTHIKSVD
jgi:hypothetical protein